jgi:hypothetical protein
MRGLIGIIESSLFVPLQLAAGSFAHLRDSVSLKVPPLSVSIPLASMDFVPKNVRQNTIE